MLIKSILDLFYDKIKILIFNVFTNPRHLRP